MKKSTSKRILSVFVALLLLTLYALFAFAEETTCQVGDHIQFGTYPQTRVEETSALKAAANAATWRSYNYYVGNGEEYGAALDGTMHSSDYMKYADFFCSGEKYRAVTFSAYRPYFTGYQSKASYSHQDDNGYTPNIVYYFKYEPLMWRILDPSTGYIMCENIIDSQAYQNSIYYSNDHYWQDETLSAYANDYSASSIRSWLNYDFYETAFTESQKSNIQTTLLDNTNTFSFIDDDDIEDYEPIIYDDTNDKIFLLTEADIDNTSFGFKSAKFYYDEAARAKATDYTKCQGIDKDIYGSIAYSGIGDSSWWLRSASGTGGHVVIAGYGGFSRFADLANGIRGIRPACKLIDLTSDISISELLFSDLHVHSYSSKTTICATCTDPGIETFTCSCGDSYTKDIPIDPNTHADLNENGDCPRCGKHIKDVEKPTEGSNEKPAEEKPTENLNIFQRIIQWFRNLIDMLFGWL